jgi:hypothetical protein
MAVPRSGDPERATKTRGRATQCSLHLLCYSFRRHRWI